MPIKSKTHIVVTPVYEDQDSFLKLIRELAFEFDHNIFIVAVDDGSVREPVKAQWISQFGVSGVVLKLHRNMGHQRAIAIGLNYVEDEALGDFVIVMDCDGEDRPPSIHSMLSAMSQNEVDICVSKRAKRSETFAFRVFYFFYKMLFNLLVGRSIDFGNFMIIRRSALKRLCSMSEIWTHLAATIVCSQLRVKRVSIDRGVRYAGKSKMNFVSLALHGFRSMMVFVEDVLVRMGLLCVIVAVSVICAILIATLLKAFGYATPGWFSNVVLSLALIFMQTATLTLVTLLSTGLFKSVSVQPPDYRNFIDNIEKTNLNNPHNQNNVTSEGPYPTNYKSDQLINEL